MNIEEFNRRGKEMIDIICEYYKNMPQRKVFPDVEQGYLIKALPPTAPEKPEKWDLIMKDTEELVMKGITHWQHPMFFAYFPAGAAWSSLLGLILSEALGIVPFSWTASPACTELEIVVTDWLARAYCLPKHFLSNSTGGGVISGSASENILNCVIAARTEAIRKVKKGSDVHDSVFLPKLMAYCSEESHSSTEKAIRLAMIQLRILPTDGDNSLRGKTLEEAILQDVANGFIPTVLSCTMGTTGAGAVDNFEELGPICQKYGMWFHLDAAYAGSSLCLPEIREQIKGIQYADSININLNKWFLAHTDCACLWVRNKEIFCNTFIIDPLYLKDGNTYDLSFDLRHWGIPLTRRFRALKVWFMLRDYGLEKMREYQRNHIKLAKYMENLFRSDPLFEVVNKVYFGLICFKLKNQDNDTNQEYLRMINEGRSAHMVPTLIKGDYVIRYSVNHEYATKEQMDDAFKLFKSFAGKAIQEAAARRKEEEEENDEQPQTMGPRTSLDFTLTIPKDVFYKFVKRQSLPDLANPIQIPKKKATKRSYK